MCEIDRSAVLALSLAIIFSSALVACGTDICNNSPCEPQINTSPEDEFTVSLESYSGAGFEWWTEFDPDYLSLINKTTISGNEQLGIVGGRERTMFTFSSKREGQTEIIMLLLRPWENGSIEERKIFPINIIPEASGPEQVKVLGKSAKPELTTISKSSFQNSGSAASSSIFSGKTNETSEVFSKDVSVMETPSQAVSEYISRGYDSSSTSQSWI
jgi:predicted secreted protein